MSKNRVLSSAAVTRTSLAKEAGSRIKFPVPPAVWSPMLALGIWEGLARGGFIDTRFFPAPSAIIVALYELAQTTQFWHDIGLSLQRMLIGFVMGAVPGLLLGLAMGLFKPVRDIFHPLVAALYPLPKIAILPLVLLMFGLGEGSKYVIVAIGAFFNMVINSSAGVLNTPKIYFDVAKNLGASRWQTYMTVALPGALSGIFTGMRLAIGVALLLLVSAEFVGADAGVGYRIWWSWSVFWVEPMYVGLFIISILGYITSNLIGLLERMFLPWRR